MQKEFPNLLYHSTMVTYILHINKRKVQQLQRFMIQLPFQPGRRRQAIDVLFPLFSHKDRPQTFIHQWPLRYFSTKYPALLRRAVFSAEIHCRLPVCVRMESLRKKEKMCRGCAGDTGNYVHLCVFPQTSALPVTWRLMKNGYLIALDKRFCSRAWYCNGSAYIFVFALQRLWL